MGNFLAVFVAFFVTKPMRSMNDFDQPLPSSQNIVLKASTAELECCLLMATFRQDVQCRPACVYSCIAVVNTPCKMGARRMYGSPRFLTR